MVKVMYPIDETMTKLKEYLQSGYVTITRFSNEGFNFSLQNWCGDWHEVRGKVGCYVFIEGLENSYALNHQDKEWMDSTLFWQGKIDINAKIKAPSYSTQKLITVKEYLEHLISKYKAIKSEEAIVSWTSMGFCTGLFIEECIKISDTIEARCIWMKEEHPRQSMFGSYLY